LFRTILVLIDTMEILDNLDRQIEAIAQGSHPAESKTTYTLGELMNLKLNEDAWLVENLLRRTGITVLAGLPDTGKSLLTLQFMLHLQRNDNDVFGLALHPMHGRALLVSTEDMATDLKERIEKMSKRLQPEVEKEDALLFCFPEDMSIDTVCASIRDAIGSKSVDLIAIDALGDIIDGMENNNTDVRRTLAPLHRIAVEFNTQVLLVHHVRKSANGLAPDAAHVQGAGAIVAKARCALMLTKEADGSRYLSVVKGNQISESIKRESMQLDFDEDSLTCEFNGVHKSRDLIGIATTSTRAKVDWTTVFRDNEPTLARSSLIHRMQAQGVSMATAQRRLEGLRRTEHGIYANPNFSHSQLPDSKEDEKIASS
jgi:KaiC/GvpD/RAD55 family RecA-like ATPase